MKYRTRIYYTEAQKSLMWGCGLARPRILVGANPTQVTASHRPGIEPCRCPGNRALDA